MFKDEETVMKKPSHVEQLMKIAEIEYEIFPTTEGDFLAYPRMGKKVAIGMDGTNGLIRQMQKRYLELTKKFVNTKTVEDAVGILKCGLDITNKREVHLRHATVGDSIFIDIGDSTGEVFVLEEGVFTTRSESPCLFRRNADISEPLPRPMPGRDLNTLFAYYGIPEEFWSRLKGFLIASLDESINVPILALDGEHGTGKTTLARILGKLIDPPAIPQSPPRNSDAWIDKASRSRLIILDNVSSIQTWFSDSLCTTITGIGERRRKLFTDRESISFNMKKVVILNGIDVSIKRNDLADRLLLIQLPVIPDEERKSDKDLDSFWKEIYPEAIASLLDLAARVHAHVKNVELAKLPRMADFAKVLKALDEIEGTNSLELYLEGIGSLAATTVESDEFLVAITKVVTNSMTVTGSELLDLLHGHKPLDKESSWPANAREVSQRLSLTAPALRRLGYQVEDLGNKNKSNTKKWRISP